MRRDARARGTLTIVSGNLIKLFSAGLVAVLCCLVLASSAQAQTLFWGPTGGGQSGSWDTTNLNWFNGTAAVPWTQGSSGSFGGTAGTVTLGEPITAQNLTFTTDGYAIAGNTLTLGPSATPIATLGAGISATISSITAGSGGLVVTGAGTLTLSSDNGISGSSPFYSGSTTVSNGGTLIFASNTFSALIGSTAFFVNGTSTLVVNAQRREDLRGTITFDGVGGGTVDFTGTNINGGVVLRGNLAIVSNGGAQDRIISSTGFGLNLNFRRLTLNTANPNDNLLVSSFISNTGSLIKTGFGTAILTAPNAYTSGTTLSAGTLTVGNDSALGTGPLSMAAGTTLSFLNTGNFVVANNISIAGDPNFAPPSGSVQTLTGVIADGTTPGTLDMQGPGTLVLTGANTYTGGTTISAGTLQLGNSGNLC